MTAPQELPANSRHLDCYRANLTLSDRSYHCTAIGRGRALDGMRMMVNARGITLEQMAREPGVTTIISVNSQRLLDEVMTDGLTARCEHGQPVTITPFTLMGAMTPVMYGAFTSNVDMRSGTPTFSKLENARSNIISGQLSRR